MWVARENDIDYIIDDGLLIKGNRVLSGSSAKRESTKLASVRRALFIEPAHAWQVKQKIKSENPSDILILGTSLNMIEAIIKALDLPHLQEVINIETVATQEEIKTAKNMRMQEGKHVIPVPTFEIKKDFSGYLLDPLKIFRPKHQDEDLFILDKSVVRPTFSYMGEYTISDNVIHTICQHEALKVDTVTRINRLWTQSKVTGLIVNMVITLKYGYTIVPEVKKIQKSVKEALQQYTALNVLYINVTVKTLTVT